MEDGKTSKIDEVKLNAAMKNIAEYLQSVSELNLKCHQQIADVFTTGPVRVEKNIPNFFPDPYADMLKIEEVTGFYEVYPIKFLGTENFKQIADIVQKLGGKYVKGDKWQGVKAYFTIPKGEGKP